MSFFFNLQEIDYHHHQHRTDHDEHDHMDGGGSTGIRSYDCVFCQRGFTTAQALGGHMNIHRKDRANPNSTTKPNNNTSPTNKEPISNNNNNAIYSNKEILLEEDDYHVDTRLFYSSNKSLLTSQDHLNNGNSSSLEGRVHRFIGDHSPSLRGGSSHMLGKRIQGHDHSQGGEELDLELRLGHYSW